jgi:hypothetical protein
MNDSYVLGRNKTKFEIAEFPKIGSNEKIGILFQGGIESTLLALIAKEIYGIANVVFILITADAVLGYKNDSNKLDILLRTFKDSVDDMGGTHTVELGDDALDRYNLSNSALKKIVSKYGSKIKFVLAGYSKVHEESVDLLKDSGWSRGFITNDKLDDYLVQNAKKYPELYKHVKKQNGKIFGVSKHIGFEQISTDYHTHEPGSKICRFNEAGGFWKRSMEKLNLRYRRYSYGSKTVIDATTPTSPANSHLQIVTYNA